MKVWLCVGPTVLFPSKSQTDCSRNLWTCRMIMTLLICQNMSFKLHMNFKREFSMHVLHGWCSTPIEQFGTHIWEHFYLWRLLKVSLDFLYRKVCIACWGTDVMVECVQRLCSPATWTNEPQVFSTCLISHTKIESGKGNATCTDYVVSTNGPRHLRKN